MNQRYLVSLAFVGGLVLVSVSLVLAAVTDNTIVLYLVLAGLALTVFGLIGALIIHGRVRSAKPTAKQQTVIQILLEVLFWLP